MTTLADAIKELLSRTKAAGDRSSIVIPLEKEVRSGTGGLKEYTFTVGRYEKKTAFYKFLQIEAWRGYPPPFRLCCFADGGQASDALDGVTVLNFVTPEHVMNEIKKRIARAGDFDEIGGGGE